MQIETMQGKLEVDVGVRISQGGGSVIIERPTREAPGSGTEDYPNPLPREELMSLVRRIHTAEQAGDT